MSSFLILLFFTVATFGPPAVLAQDPPPSEKQELAEEYLSHARSFRDTGLWPQVLVATERAEELLDDQTSVSLRTEVAIARAGALQALERSRESLEIALPALQAARDAGLPGLELRALINISSAYSRAGQHEAALDAVKQGYGLAEQLEDAEHRQRFLLNRARIYLALQDWDGMQKAVDQAAAIERDEAVSDLDTTLLLARLSVARMQGDLEAGRQLAQSAVDRSAPDSYYGAFAREALADMLCALGHAEDALLFYRQALATFEMVEAPWDQSRAAKAYGACLEQTGDLPQALQALTISREQLKRVHERRQADAVAAMEAMTRSDGLRAELARVRQKNEALSRLRLWQGIALSVSLALVLALMLWGVQQFRRQRIMTYQARHDALTGLSNRRGFEDEANSMFDRQRKDGKAPALLSIDLDHFKRVNDRFGHPAGDEVLVIFSALLRASTRSGDLLGRVGGEEFSILLPSASKNRATAVGERIRKRVASADFSAIDLDLQTTCSIGLAVADEQDIDSMSDLMALADRRLYKAKQAGRNCVIDSD